MLWRPKHHKRILQLADGMTNAASFIVAYFIWNAIRLNIKLPVGHEIEYSWNDIWKLLGLCVVWVILFNSFNAYTYRRFTSRAREIAIVFKTNLFGVLIFFAAIFLFRFQYIPRSYILIFAFVNFCCLAIEKLVLFQVASFIRKKGSNRKKVLIVGTGNKAKNLAQKIKDNLGWGLDIIGFLSEKDNETGNNLVGKKVLGSFSDIEETLHNNVVDEVIISVPEDKFAEARNIFEVCEKEGVQVRLNSDFFGYLAKRVSVDYVYDIPLVSFFTTSQNEWGLYIKRIMDIFISALALLVLSPLFLIIAVLIKATSKGPVFYRWNVVGLNKRPFVSWKFRTMVQNAEELKEKLKEKNEMKGPVFKIKNDPRVTKVGRFLRKFSLDELPQLWSVLKGDISLVGPRPPLQSEVFRFESWHRRKLSMKPGITCLWQVSGRNEIKDFDEWARLDMWYIDHWSLWLDIRILFLTVLTVLKGTGR